MKMRNQGPLLSVVVPTFNEAENVHNLYARLLDVLHDFDWEVLFVDDDSPDGTASLVRRIGRADARVRCVHRIGRRGLSTACIEGMLASSSPYMAVMDCDLQHDPAILREMLLILTRDEAEIVIASRYMDGGGCGNWSSGRRRVSRLATFISHLLLSKDLKDPMSNFFALRREVFEESADRLSGLSFKILFDILLSLRGPVRLREVPYVLGERQAGESKFQVAVAWEFAMLLADKTIGRYIPLRIVAVVATGMIVAVAYLAIVATAYKGFGLDFVIAEILAATVSLICSYAVNNVLSYGDRRKHGLGWLGGLASFMSLYSVGVAANVVLASYLLDRGVSWFVAATSGVLAWLGWNFTATSAYAWGAKRYSTPRTAPRQRFRYDSNLKRTYSDSK